MPQKKKVGSRRKSRSSGGRTARNNAPPTVAVRRRSPRLLAKESDVVEDNDNNEEVVVENTGVVQETSCKDKEEKNKQGKIKKLFAQIAKIENNNDNPEASSPFYQKHDRLTQFDVDHMEVMVKSTSLEVLMGQSCTIGDKRTFFTTEKMKSSLDNNNWTYLARTAGASFRAKISAETRNKLFEMVNDWHHGLLEHDGHNFLVQGACLVEPKTYGDILVECGITEGVYCTYGLKLRLTEELLLKWDELILVKPEFNNSIDLATTFYAPGYCVTARCLNEERNTHKLFRLFQGIKAMPTTSTTDVEEEMEDVTTDDIGDTTTAMNEEDHDIGGTLLFDLDDGELKLYSTSFHLNKAVSRTVFDPPSTYHRWRTLLDVLVDRHIPELVKAALRGGTNNVLSGLRYERRFTGTNLSEAFTRAPCCVGDIPSVKSLSSNAVVKYYFHSYRDVLNNMLRMVDYGLFGPKMCCKRDNRLLPNGQKLQAVDILAAAGINKSVMIRGTNPNCAWWLDWTMPVNDKNGEIVQSIPDWCRNDRDYYVAFCNCDNTVENVMKYLRIEAPKRKNQKRWTYYKLNFNSNRTAGQQKCFNDREELAQYVLDEWKEEWKDLFQMVKL